ncbi:ankyrin repeat-containing domain protein [Colletotrichum navitas]|uniref:Ankyrin repeat domain-containing protein 54 n=1 Tax=Colletotrichum navitas TaxID=681940 RepID=A0AAD8V2T2_9PEZI|nr:ankyrin repeat-containing domain protein [Colletotrichum navitas]KAK1585128.1 ankyrin repeat-containing domain protein [Colletotrichum navitas]
MDTSKRTHSNAQSSDDQDNISTKRTRLDGSDLNQAPSRRPLKRKEYYFAMVSGRCPEGLERQRAERISEDAMDRICLRLVRRVAELEFLPIFQNDPEPLPKAKQEKSGFYSTTQEEYPFVEYTISHLFHHADCAAGSMPQVYFMKDLSTDRAGWIVVENLLQKYGTRRLHETISLFCILAIHSSAGLIQQYFPHNLQETGAEHYCTPLHTAISKDSEEEAEAKLSCRGKHLHEILPKVANEEVNVDHPGSKGRTALLLAAGKGHDGDVHRVYGSEYVLLHISAQRGSLHVARILLANGARVNQADQNGRTPLHYAQYFHPKVTRELIDNGAYVNLRDNIGGTPILSRIDLGINET